MFLGTHYPKLDEKGRLFLPAKFRDKLVEGLVITTTLKECLAVFPVAEFARLSETLRDAPGTDPDILREFFSSADDPSMDKAGRVTLHPDLRRFANLDKDCVAIGVNNRFEIWDRAAWDQFLAGVRSSSGSRTEVIPGVF